MSTWIVTYEGFDPARERRREALCTLGNGYFGTRGATPESAADPTHYPGTYIAGCYDRLVSQIAGRSVPSEDLVNAPNWLPLSFRAAGAAWFDPGDPGLLAYRQELDMHRGLLTRRLRYRDDAGRITTVEQQRLVSMDDPHLAGLWTTIRAENWSGPLEIRSALDCRVTNGGVERYRQLSGDHLVHGTIGVTGDLIWLDAETRQSAVRIALTARTTAHGGEYPRWQTHEEPDRVIRALTVEARRGEPVTVEKTIALFTSRDQATDGFATASRHAARTAPSFAGLRRRHALAWDHLWRRGRLGVGHGGAQRMINLHLFHVLQTLSPHTVGLDVGVPARGLHGEAYRGHVFWDELFVLPFLSLRFPDVVRALLLYRWRRLPAARGAARQAGYAGAMYPWQSGGDGSEQTQPIHYNPRSGRWLPDNSHLQRHVGLGVAYSVWQYYQATGDLPFMSAHGAEMLIEIARFWASAARLDARGERYDLRGVMGPDEYHDGYPGAATPGLDNNSYTNVMAVWTLCRALDALALLPPDRRDELVERLDLSPEELARFADVSRRMRVLFHDDGVISQFEGYAGLEEFDWDGYRNKYDDIRRLDRILEAEGDTPNRYKASKQADVLMLFYLLSADELGDLLDRLGYPHDRRTVSRTVEYYLDRTSHGSTLSAVVHAWVLARSDRRASWRFFLEALDSDVHDVQGGTTGEGIHLGAMAGTLDLAQRCYTGIELRDDVLRLNPHLPPGLPALGMELRYRGHWGVRLRVDHRGVSVGLRRSAQPPVRIAVGGRRAMALPAGRTLWFGLKPEEAGHVHSRRHR